MPTKGSCRLFSCVSGQRRPSREEDYVDMEMSEFGMQLRDTRSIKLWSITAENTEYFCKLQISNKAQRWWWWTKGAFCLTQKEKRFNNYQMFQHSAIPEYILYSPRSNSMSDCAFHSLPILLAIFNSRVAVAKLSSAM